MSKPPKPTVTQRIGEADSLFSMGQRAWEVISSQWPSIATFFAAGGGLTFLAYITDWARALGPLGVGLIVLACWMIAAITLATFELLRAGKNARQAKADTINKWNSIPSSINPLEKEFHKQRIKLPELASPIEPKLSEKRFIDCELFGPANVTFMGDSHINKCQFVECDFAVIRIGSWITNVIALDNTTILNCVFWRCTIFLTKDMLDHISKDITVPVITFTGDPLYDNRPPSSTVKRRQP